ncbi:MAG: substrate-binding domain-containing protein [Clostridia bacterium]|nr:substrate-binding domain-containing protein [Clostridia bacterium]
MSRKVYYAIIAAFCAAIAVAFVLYTDLLSSTARDLRGIILIKTENPEYDFWRLVSQGAEAGAREFGVNLEIAAPADEDSLEAQLALLDWAVEQTPDFIVLAPQDRVQFREAASRVRKAGIRLILMDSTVEAGEQAADCFVGIHNAEAAALLSSEMTKALGGRGQVAILAHPTASSTAHERLEAISAALAGWPGIELVEVVISGDNPERSREETLRLLEQYPDLAGIIATNQMCTQGVAEALQRHPERDIAFYAFDTAPSQNAALEAGIADGFIVQLAFNMGYLSVQAGWQSCTDQLAVGRIDSGYVYATRENMREDDMEKLIYPFV